MSAQSVGASKTSLFEPNRLAVVTQNDAAELAEQSRTSTACQKGELVRSATSSFTILSFKTLTCHSGTPRVRDDGFASFRFWRGQCCDCLQ